MKVPRFFNGFTMIELLVVTTIIVVLTTIGLVSFQSTTRNARNAKRKADLEAIRSALVLYRSDEGEYLDGSGTSVSFTQMVTDLYAADYYSNPTLSDPKDVAPYVYTYDSDTVDFELCGHLEPDPGDEYCLTNP